MDAVGRSPCRRYALPEASCRCALHSSKRRFLLWSLILITDTYGYAPQDIVVLKDDPSLPEHLQPTRVNMVSLLQCPISVNADSYCTPDP